MILPLRECWKGTDIDVIQTLTSHQSYLESNRQDYEPLWQDIIDNLNFNRYNFLQNKTKGQKSNALIYDGSPITAWKLLCAGILGNVFTQSQAWFSLTLPNVVTFPRDSVLRKYNGRLDQIPQVKMHLEDKQDQMYAAVNRSNFYNEIYMMIADASSIGTATLYAEEDLARKKINFLCMNPGECYIAENRFGEVDTMFRKFAMTARAAAQIFPKELMEPGLQNAVDNTPYALYNFIHACFPRDDIQMYFGKDGKMKEKAGADNTRWVSMYIQGGNAASTSQTPSTGGVGTKVLKKSGYSFNPFITWRWLKNSEEVYGRSPAMDAIVDIMKLNVVGKTMLHAAQLSVEPPMLVHEKFRNRLRLGPRGRNYATANEMGQEVIKPIQTGMNFQVGIDRENQLRKIIEQHFMTDYFVMLWKAAMEGSQLSVPQVLEMQGEKASIMMPMMERMLFDLNNPLIDVVDMIEENAGRMPEPSDFVKELLMPFAGQRMPVQYNGPLAVAQKRWAKAQGVLQGLEMLGPLAKVDPSVMDVVDMTGTAMEIVRDSGWPAKGIRTVDEIQKLRQERAQAQQSAHNDAKAEKLLENAAGLSQMLKNVGPDKLPQIAGAMQGGGGLPQ